MGCASDCQQRNVSLAGRSLIVVANDGLWYTDADNWKAALQRAFVRAEDLGMLSQSVNHLSRRSWTTRSPSRSVCLLWRETGPQHFAARLGTFRKQSFQKSVGWQTPKGCMPHQSLATSPWEPMHKVLEDRFGIPVIRVWNASRQHWDRHIANRTSHMLYRDQNATMHGNFDCTHWCTPGVVDLWLELILQSLIAHCPSGPARSPLFKAAR